MVARAIHNRSSRQKHPLVKVNCAALPANLIESELFGHEAGAFTGAQTQQIGRFEVADGTSIFLDEIGELPLELQTKMLQVLQDGEFERLGSSRTIKVDVRVIAATNRDLEAEVRKGRFREDLFYRLNVFPITVPPLRERIEDISLLAEFFMEKVSKRLGKSIELIPAKCYEYVKELPLARQRPGTGKRDRKGRDQLFRPQAATGGRTEAAASGFVDAPQNDGSRRVRPHCPGSGAHRLESER